MNANKVNYNGRFEINDLIDDAVKNAVARRSQVIDLEDALFALAETEAQSIVGGAAAAISKPILITGKIAAPQPICPPPTVAGFAPVPKPTPMIVCETVGLIANFPRTDILTAS